MKPHSNHRLFETGSFEQNADRHTATMWEPLLDCQFNHAIEAVHSGLHAYQTLRNVNEAVG